MSNGRSYRRGRRRQGVRVGGQRVHTNEKVATMTAIAADPDGVELAKRKTHDQLIATLGTARAHPDAVVVMAMAKADQP